MAKRVAVEQSLSSVADYLAERGYEVVRVNSLGMRAGDLKDCAAVVISGQDSNLLGQEDIAAEIPVIQAEGRTNEEISAMLAERIRLLH
ncbi:MAG: hypothetical protein PWP65_2075 [Clostridia bacterium]|nr:hypothetical protein [Clostridia bacterium]